MQIVPNKEKNRMANSVDPYETACYKLSHLDLVSVLVCRAETVKRTNHKKLIVSLLLNPNIGMPYSPLVFRPEQIVQTQIRYCRMQHLIRDFTVCHPSRSLYTSRRERAQDEDIDESKNNIACSFFL